MTSKEMRNNPLFMRNNFVSDGKWELHFDEMQGNIIKVDYMKSRKAVR